MLTKFHLDKVHIVKTQINKTALLQPRTEDQATTSERERYQDMTGSIMFSIVETRPDIAFATSVASRFAKNLGHQHIKAVKTIF